MIERQTKTDTAARLAQAFRDLGRVTAWSGVDVVNGALQSIDPEAFVEVALDAPLAGWVEIDLRLSRRELRKVDVVLVADTGERMVAPLLRTEMGRYRALMQLPSAVRVVLRPQRGFRFGRQSLSLTPRSRFAIALTMVRRGVALLLADPALAIEVANRLWRKLRTGQPAAISPREAAAPNADRDYQDWIRYREPEDGVSVSSDANTVNFCVLVRATGDDEAALAATLRALKVQTHTCFSCLIVCPQRAIVPARSVAAAGGWPVGRLDVIDDQLATSEDFLARAQWLIVTRAGVMPREFALTCFAQAIARNLNAGMVYADEDVLDERGKRAEPFFKPDWSPDYFRSTNYTGEFCALHIAPLVDALSSSDTVITYDLVLRMMEIEPRLPVVHVPRVLYHIDRACRRAAEQEFAARGEAALQAHYARTGEAVRIERVPGTPFLRSRYPLPEARPLVSLLIPMKDKPELTQKCLDSIFDRSSKHDVEVLLLNNNSSEPATAAFFDRVRGDPRVTILDYPHPFNYAALNNLGAARAKGVVLGLLNNDVEAITADWLDELVSQALRPDIGCVGAMLYYPDDAIQHAGIVLGIGGAAGHAFRFTPRGTAGDHGRLRAVREVTAVTGACLFVRSEIFRQVGGFDAEAFPVTFNDVDFCLKVLRAGYRNLWTPFAALYHRESVSRGFDVTPERRERLEREARACWRRWPDLFDNDPYYSPALTRESEDFGVRVE